MMPRSEQVKNLALKQLMASINKLSPAAAAPWASGMRPERALMASIKLPPAAAAPWAACMRPERALMASLKLPPTAAAPAWASSHESSLIAEEGRGRKGVDELRLFSTWESPFGMRVKVALHEKGLQFETVEEVVGRFSPEVILSNPVHKKIPVLLHNGKPLCDSRIIVEYIDEQWPASSSSSSSSRPNFMPASPWARAQTRFWSDFVESQICPDSYCVMIHTGEKQQLAIKKITQHLYQVDKDALKLETPHSLDSTKKFGSFFNDENTIGFFDITFVGLLQWFRAFEFISPFKMPNAHECPRLHAWIEAISEEASVRKSIPNLELLIKHVQTARCSRNFDDWNTLYKS